MEKAGLNVGLMYGGQGQGGQIMNPGGSASGGNIDAKYRDWETIERYGYANWRRRSTKNGTS